MLDTERAIRRRALMDAVHAGLKPELTFEETMLYLDFRQRKTMYRKLESPRRPEGLRGINQNPGGKYRRLVFPAEEVIRFANGKPRSWLRAALKGG